MRRPATLIPLIIVIAACTKAETPAGDTSMAIAPAPAAVAPVAISEADVAGTWTGTSTALGSDSVMSHWTQVCAAGSCKGTSEESKTIIPSTYTLAGDSAVGVTTAFDGEGPLKGHKLIDHWTVHISDGKATGSGIITIASRPDSVVLSYTFTGSKRQ